MDNSGNGLHGYSGYTPSYHGDTPSDGSHSPGSAGSGEEQVGYDYKFVPVVDDNYECPICTLVLRNPVQTECGHRFCGNCIRKWIRENQKPEQVVHCPICSTVISEEQLFSDNFAKREILSLTVMCSNQADGCSVVMEIRHIHDHVKNCDYGMIQCTNNCSVKLRRKDLQHHLEEECQQRKVPCLFCHAQIAISSFQIHMETQCDLVTVSCQYCGKSYTRHELIKMKLIQLQDHVEKDCDKMLIPCTFAKFGCSTKVERDQLQTHLQLQTQAHMQLLAGALYTLTESDGSTPGRAKVSEARRCIASSVEDPPRPTYNTSDSGLGSGTPHSSGYLLHTDALHSSVSSELDSSSHMASNDGLSLNIPTGYSDPFPMSSRMPATIERTPSDVFMRKGFRASMGSMNLFSPSSRQQCLENTISELVEKNGEQERKLTVQGQALYELQTKNLALERSVKDQERKLRELEEKVKDFQQRNCHGTYVWCVTDYSHRKVEAQRGRNTVIHSPGFYTSSFGYKLCIRLNINGVEGATGSHVSLFVHFMQGDYDDILDWPFSGRITLAIIDQSDSCEQRQHISEMLLSKPTLAAFQRPKTHRNHKGFGYVEFAPISLVEGGGPVYVKNDAVYIKVKVVEE